MAFSTTILELQRTEFSSKEFPITVTGYLKATQMLSEALVTNNLDKFFAQINDNFNFTTIHRSLTVKNADATLSINFFENRLITQFQGIDKSVKLSCALGIVSELSEIFSKIVSTAGSSQLAQLASIEDEFTRALDEKGSARSEVKLIIDGKEEIAIYPLNGRVVLRDKSSIPIEMIQNCAHLFNRKFAKEISPLLGVSSDVNGLLAGINNLYLGRCILGFAASVIKQRWSELENQREFSRIVSLIQMPRSAFYTQPLL